MIYTDALGTPKKAEDRQILFDVDFADAFLLTNDFDLIANFICQSDGPRDRFDKNEW